MAFDKRKYQREYMRKYSKTEKGREKGRLYAKNLRRKWRKEAIEHYSNGTMRCACCGETHIEFLTIDHTIGNGAEHRKDIGVSAGSRFIQWLRQNNYPEGYRVLCYNCNCSLGFYGYCPHDNTDQELPETTNAVHDHRAMLED